MRLIQVLVLGIYLMHLFSCFWNLAAKIYRDDSDPAKQSTTWIARNGKEDATVPKLYVLGLYWAL